MSGPPNKIIIRGKEYSFRTEEQRSWMRQMIIEHDKYLAELSAARQQELQGEFKCQDSQST